MKKQDVAVAVVKINFSPSPPSPLLRNVLCRSDPLAALSSSLSRHNACIHASLIVQVACMRDEKEREGAKKSSAAAKICDHVYILAKIKSKVRQSR